MIFSLLFGGGDFLSVLISLLISMPIMLLALSVHETAHGYVAWKFGDNTAYNLGRLTLNPLRHFDPIGLLCLLIFGYGWAKPVPINTRNFRNPKWGMALSALAGPVSNLILGAVSAVLYGVFLALWNYFKVVSSVAYLVSLFNWLCTAFWIGALINFMYAVFNLIPIPPFDGSRVALAFLPAKTYFGIMKYERQIMFGLLFVLIILSYGFHFSPFSAAAQWLTRHIASPVANGTLRLLLR